MLYYTIHHIEFICLCTSQIYCGSMCQHVCASKDGNRIMELYVRASLMRVGTKLKREQLRERESATERESERRKE